MGWQARPACASVRAVPADRPTTQSHPYSALAIETPGLAREASFWTAAHGRPGRLDPHVLQRVLDAARQSGSRGLIVFDLDSTLLDNKPRQARILREFGRHHGVDELLICEPHHFRDWSLRPPMLGCGLPDETVQSLLPKVREFWLERFFTSDYCIDDIALPGATEYVRRIADTGARIVYCTGRHQPEMRPGTIESFSREGFPLPDDERVYLLMKPEFSMHDDDWKRIVRAQLEALGEVVAAFDNEPTHINTYREAFPSAQCVHILTDDSARGIPVIDDIPSVHDFRLP
jgi:hypothetical protein